MAPNPALGYPIYDTSILRDWTASHSRTGVTPTLAYWQNDFVLAHKGDGTNKIFMRVLGIPRATTGPAYVWGPRVEQEGSTSRTPLVVKVHNLDGSERGLWLMYRQSSSVMAWRESRGGQ